MLKNPADVISDASFPVIEFRSSLTVLSPCHHNLKYMNSQMTMMLSLKDVATYCNPDTQLETFEPCVVQRPKSSQYSSLPKVRPELKG